MLVMSALKDALSDSNPKTRLQASDYFAAAFGDAAQMCPAKTAHLLSLFTEHLVIYKGEDAYKHGKLLLSFLEDIPGLWFTYSHTELASVFSTAKLIILTTKLAQLLYRIESSGRWWAIWTLPRFARVRLTSMFDWESDKVYRPYFDLLTSRLYMFPDTRAMLPPNTFAKLIDSALLGNIYVADYLKRSNCGNDGGWTRRAMTQLRVFIEGNNVEAAISVSKVLSLVNLPYDQLTTIQEIALNTKDFRLLKELVSLLSVKECANTLLLLYHKGMEQMTHSLSHFDYFLATCISSVKAILMDLQGVVTVLALPYVKEVVLRLGCDLLESNDMRSAYLISNIALFPMGRRLLGECRVLPAVIKHLSKAAEGRDESRVRDLLPVVKSLAWNESLLLEDPEKSGLEELLAMRSHTCNWESEETGKSVFRVIEGEWMARELAKDEFSTWDMSSEGLSTEDSSLKTLISTLTPSIDSCPLSIYLRLLSPSLTPTVTKGRETRSILSMESLAAVEIDVEVRNFLLLEGVSPYSILARWREYRYLSVLPGGLALRFSVTEDRSVRETMERRLLRDLMKCCLETGKSAAELAGSRFLPTYESYLSLLPSM